MQTPNPESELTLQTGERSFAKRWKHAALFGKGFVAIPTLFLHFYAHLKPHRLTTGEALFVLHLMEFKWDTSAPFPGYATIAQRMGISSKMARRHAQSLEAKGYLRREIRVGQTNRFDLSPLFDALLKGVQAEEKHKKRIGAKKAKPADQMIDWLRCLVEASTKLPAKERRALKEWEALNVDGANVTTSDWPGWEKYTGKKPGLTTEQ